MGISAENAAKLTRDNLRMATKGCEMMRMQCGETETEKPSRLLLQVDRVHCLNPENGWEQHCSNSMNSNVMMRRVLQRQCTLWKVIYLFTAILKNGFVLLRRCCWLPSPSSKGWCDSRLSGRTAAEVVLANKKNWRYSFVSDQINDSARKTDKQTDRQSKVQICRHWCRGRLACTACHFFVHHSERALEKENRKGNSQSVFKYDFNIININSTKEIKGQFARNHGQKGRKESTGKKLIWVAEQCCVT